MDSSRLSVADDSNDFGDSDPLLNSSKEKAERDSIELQTPKPNKAKAGIPKTPVVAALEPLPLLGCTKVHLLVYLYVLAVTWMLILVPIHVNSGEWNTAVLLSVLLAVGMASAIIWPSPLGDFVAACILVEVLALSLGVEAYCTWSAVWKK
jgi:hypothetical protein